MQNTFPPATSAIAGTCLLLAALVVTAAAQPTTPSNNQQPTAESSHRGLLAEAFSFRPFLAQATPTPQPKAREIKPVVDKGDDTPRAKVPDGGVTVLMMGGAFVGLALLVKKLKQ